MSTEIADSLKFRIEATDGWTYSRLGYYLLGVFLTGIAILVPNEQYSASLSGGAKDLSWGPILFRVLLGFHGAMIILFGTGTLKWLSRPATQESTKDSSLGVRTLLILAALSIAAIALRLWNLDSPPWIDEVLTLVDFVRLPINEIVITFPSQNQHMLYSVFARGAFAVFGESTWALRLPAVLFGVGSIWALYFFGRRTIGARPALLACALMTVSYHHVWFSQNGRGYTGLLMMTLLATWAWLQALRRDELRWWVLYIVSIVAGMWIHTTMAFVVAAHGLTYIAFLLKPSLSGEEGSLERGAGIKPIVAWLFSVTATLQLYALSLPEFIRTGLHEESRNSEWTNPIWVLTESIHNLSIGFAGTAVVMIALAFVAFGWISIYMRDRRAAVLMVLPPMLSGGLMLALGHNLFPRFFFFAMGFGILIVVHGAVALPKVIFASFERLTAHSRAAGRLGVGFALFMIAISLLTVPRNYALPKQDFAGAREFVESRVSAKGKAVAINLAGDMFAKYYAPNWITTRDLSDVASLDEQTDEVWLVYTMPFEIQAFNPELWKTIQSDFEVVRSFPGTLNGGDVVVCRKRGDLTKK